MSMRWKVLYTLADMAVNLPEQVLELLISELNDDKHERWMTKKEWLLFLIHHLSYRIPSKLEPYVEPLIKIILNADFPHAKMRYHAKETILNINNNRAGVLAPDKLERIESVNEPKEFLKPIGNKRRDIPYGSRRQSDNKDNGFDFDPIDTLKYWYSPLSHCFSKHRCHVADIAYKWIVDKWGITDKKCSEEDRRNKNKYKWTDTSNDHGSEPAVETLRLYAERHAMFMAAGELIDSHPVLLEGDEETDRWHDWMRYHLREADPLLTGRFVESPPLIPGNYGIFQPDFSDWIKKDKEEDFRNSILLEEKPGWIVAAGIWEGSFAERYFNTSVDSALVSSKTANALSRLINNQDDSVFLPYIKAGYDTILSEFEKDLEQNIENYESNENEILEESGIFKLKYWLVYWNQEMPFHSHDPKWTGQRGGYYFPSMDFCQKQGLLRDPNSLAWKNGKGEIVAYHENWNDYKSRTESSDYTEGFRLLVKQDVICDYLKKLGLSLIFKVTLRRQKTHRFARDEEDNYDKGTDRAYILSPEGVLK